MQRFEGKTAFVTGAGSGIGRAVAQRLAAEGARVVCADIAGHDDTAAGIGDAAIGVPCDVTDFAAVEAAVATATATFGPLDVVANIAGIGWFRRTEEETAEGFAKIIAVNLTGTFHVCRAAIPGMLANGGGAIVNTASTAGVAAQPWSAAYCASKGGIVMLTKSLGYEYAGTGLRVNAVAPGGVNTPITGGFVPPKGADQMRMVKMMSPIGMVEPEEMAASFAFAASDEMRYMTGAIIVHDGGITA